MRKIIFHIDVNSAYLSWTAVEELKKGAKVDLRQIPAIIGGDQKSRHGVVLAKSPLAKKYGIRTGEPVVNAFRKCPNLSICVHLLKRLSRSVWMSVIWILRRSRTDFHLRRRELNVSGRA